MCMRQFKSSGPIHKYDKKIGLYVTTIFKNENDVMKAIEYLSIPTNELPDDLATVATTAANCSWGKS